MELTSPLSEVRAGLFSDGKLLAIGFLLAAVILAFDLFTPLGVADGIPYVGLMLLCLWARHPASTVIMAATGTVATTIGYFFSPDGGIDWVVLTNRAVAIFAIWSVALFSAKRLADIQGRELAEARRHTFERRLSDVLRLSSEAIVSANSAGQIEFFNVGAENVFGYKAEEVVGRQLDILIPEAARDAHRAHMQRFAQGSVSRRPMAPRSELVGVRKDGSKFPATASISKINTEGGTLYTAILHDITDRLEAEERLRHAQKLESIGQLTGGIAHEFNNLLMVILGNAQMIEGLLGEDDPLKEYTSSVMAGAQRGALLTRSLLAFSRKQTLDIRIVDLNVPVLGMQKLFRQVLRESITIRTDLEEDLWLVSTDLGQIEAALLNFVINARDAMPDGGTITVRTSNRRVSGDMPPAIVALPSGDYCVLEVIDTGTGMTADVKSHAFEPFYTTKEIGKGSGLGLSAVYGFAKQSGGYVEVDTEVGKGTSMRLYLPRSREQQRDAPEEVAELKETKKRSGTILILEDDAEVRALAATQLAALGYEVVEAEDGLAALTILEGRPDIDLLFADIVLPGEMSGPETVHEARGKYPNLKALLVSGYPEKDVEDLIINGEGITILRKPYMKAELERAIAAAMINPVSVEM